MTGWNGWTACYEFLGVEPTAATAPKPHEQLEIFCATSIQTITVGRSECTEEHFGQKEPFQREWRRHSNKTPTVEIDSHLTVQAMFLQGHQQRIKS